MYDLGNTAARASQFDQRFSYCCYVPKSFPEENPQDYRILAVIHGTGRKSQDYRSYFADLACSHKLIVLAPLFPCGILDEDDRDNYKYIQFHNIRFDLVFLSMLEEVSRRYGVPGDNILMFGFSGGAHFTHRFMYLHPRKISAVSVAAPGSVTLLDTDKDWWVGIRNVDELFGCSIDLDALRKIKVHLFVGGDDTETWEITHREGSPHWMIGANGAGVTRIERLESLACNLRANGLDVAHEVVSGIRHQTHPVLTHAVAYFDQLLHEKENAL